MYWSGTEGQEHNVLFKVKGLKLPCEWRLSTSLVVRRLSSLLMVDVHHWYCPTGFWLETSRWDVQHCRQPNHSKLQKLIGSREPSRNWQGFWNSYPAYQAIVCFVDLPGDVKEGLPQLQRWLSEPPGPRQPGLWCQVNRFVLQWKNIELKGSESKEFEVFSFFYGRKFLAGKDQIQILPSDKLALGSNWTFSRS